MSDLHALGKLLSGARTGTFHLEALGCYTVEGEMATVDAYLRGEPEMPRSQEVDEFFAQISQDRGEGKVRTRVHAIAGPLTPYLRYEVEWAYTACAAAGEDIHIVHSPSWRESPFRDQPPDFYLVDDEIAAVMHYDHEGHWLGFDLVTKPDEVADYRRLRDLSRRHSTPLKRYLAAMRAAPIDPLVHLRILAERMSG